MRNDLQDTGQTSVAVIGAGPYGLSIAAHLAEAGIPHRVFGSAMHTWRERIPVGMKMKSDGFATNLSSGRDPRRHFSFREFCEERGIPYKDAHHAMPSADFVAYGLEFQRRFVPELDTREVARVEREADGFAVTLEDGERLLAGSVVCATGIMHYAWIPPAFSNVPDGLVTHSSAYRNYAAFRGMKVAVIGAGASAIEAAALLHEAGADATVVARRPKVLFHDAPTGRERSIYQRVRHPSSQLGPGLRSWLSEKAPGVFRTLPRGVRHEIVRRHLGPSSGWYMRERVEGKVRFLLGSSIDSVEARDGCVKLTLSRNGQREELAVQRVIAGTGYRVDMRRLTFLEPLLDELRTVDGSPVLNRRFESNVSGLYFAGTAAATTYGPLLRFVAGAPFAAGAIVGGLRGRVLRTAR
jgi:thioredoxin reductase